jgi:hypothetical protein
MTADMVEQLRKEEVKVRRKIEDLRSSIEKELCAAEADLTHIMGMISYYERQRNENNQVVLVARRGSDFHLLNLRGHTHKQAVIAIAKHNNGVVKASEAKALMIRAGIMAETKNSYRMARHAILSSGAFEKTAPGEYRLKNFPPSVATARPATEEDMKRIIN